LKPLVIDASVALKWFLPDERYGAIALDILDKFVSKEIEIFAPSLLEYEVLNGLLIAARRGRIPKKTVLIAAEGLMDLDIEVDGISSFFPEALHFSKSHNLTAYDASYLAVASARKTELVTADENLYNKVKRDLQWIKHLGEFSL
jgi:predicted nucleic acid-binding protein